MKGMQFKGYTAAVEYDGDDEIFVGRIIGLNDGVGFHADTVEELKAAFKDAVEGYIDACKKIGKTPEKPYSGQIMVRVDPQVHANSAIAAELSGKSLAKWAEEKLRIAAEQELHLA